MMTPEQFQQYARQGYNRIPVMREVLADLDTPLSAYLKLANQPYTYLFESVRGGEQWGRYSIIGLTSATMIEVSGQTVVVKYRDSVISSEQVENPLQWIEQYFSRFKVPEIDGQPRFSGGLVGYFGYETIGYIEPRLRHQDKQDPLNTPDILLMQSEDVLVFDNLSGKLLFITHANPANNHAYENAQQKLDNWVSALRE